MSHENYEKFSDEIIPNNAEVSQKLADAGDCEAFARIASEEGEKAGLSFTAQEVQDVMDSELPDLDTEGDDVVGGSRGRKFVGIRARARKRRAGNVFLTRANKAAFAEDWIKMRGEVLS